MTANNPFTLSSSAFADGQPVPQRHSGDGADLSPPLSWTGVPAGTKELALICDDPDAPTPEPWVHWVLYRIPGNTDSLPEGIGKEANLKLPAGAKQGKNSWKSGQTLGYRGPAPPPGHGVHHYQFRLFALDTTLALPASADKRDLQKAMTGHILAEAILVGTYQR